MLWIALVLVLLALTAIGFFLMKRRQHLTLSTAYRDLEQTKDKLQSAEDRILKLLSRQVSPQIAEELISSEGQATERRFVCIMFLDIRDFTPMAEKMEPEELIEYQNRVFGFMIDIIHRHHGNVNQFLGDGFMSTFGAPQSFGNDCELAVKAAREILSEIHRRVEAELIPPTRVGIGLHAGEVVTGNVGTETRKQYSITGKTVIIASRVEQLTKKFQSELIITEAVYEQLADKSLGAGETEETNVKGRVDPLKIFLVQ